MSPHHHNSNEYDPTEHHTHHHHRPKLFDMWDYEDLKEYFFTKDVMQYPYTTQKKLFEKRIANILETQQKRITLDVQKDTIIIDVTKNRNVAITLPKLQMLQTLFDAEDIIIMTPIRCKLTLKLKRRYDVNGT